MRCAVALGRACTRPANPSTIEPHSVWSAIAGDTEIGPDLLVSLDVNVNTAVEALVVEAVLGAGVEAGMGGGWSLVPAGVATAVSPSWLA